MWKTDTASRVYTFARRCGLLRSPNGEDFRSGDQPYSSSTTNTSVAVTFYSIRLTTVHQHEGGAPNRDLRSQKDLLAVRRATAEQLDMVSALLGARKTRTQTENPGTQAAQEAKAQLRTNHADRRWTSEGIVAFADTHPQAKLCICCGRKLGSESGLLVEQNVCEALPSHVKSRTA